MIPARRPGVFERRRDRGISRARDHRALHHDGGIRSSRKRLADLAGCALRPWVDRRPLNGVPTAMKVIVDAATAPARSVVARFCPTWRSSRRGRPRVGTGRVEYATRAGSTSTQMTRYLGRGRHPHQARRPCTDDGDIRRFSLGVAGIPDQRAPQSSSG